MSAAKTIFTVRPLSRPARTDLRDALRVNLSASALFSLKSKAGDLCFIQKDSSDNVPGQPVIAWQAAEKIHDNVVQISKLLQDLSGLNLGDKVSISKGATSAENAQVVTLTELPPDGNPDGTEAANARISDEDISHWAWLMGDPLSRAEVLTCGLYFESIPFRGQKPRFVISKIDATSSNSTNAKICKFGSETRVDIVRKGKDNVDDESTKSTIWPQVKSDGIGGQRSAVEQINRLLRSFDPTFRTLTQPFNYQPTQGILLYGLKGVGKTLMIDQIATSSWNAVIRIQVQTDRPENIQSVFKEARSEQPALIILEDIEALSSQSATDYNNSPRAELVSALCRGFQQIQDAAIVVVAEARHPNDVHEGLRTPHRLGIEVELQIPSADGRLEVLRCIRGAADQPSDDVLEDIAQRTHGYVGADLFALYQQLIETAAHRNLEALDKTERGKPNSIGEPPDSIVDGTSTTTEPSQTTLVIDPEDIAAALAVVRPTAMQEIFLEKPNVRWHDIGGNRQTKKHLQRSVERPLRLAATMSRLNLRGERGILLYGPPGCSKTLLAKALASESGLNFLAVKGAELVSMYVGESERAVREVFRKARAASPSIIFFDEFDAIACGRQKSGSSSSGGGGSSSNMNILTTLLNELDGFESLRNVLVLAATNRPEILDSALLRPGRLDKLIYVGPPDLEARIEILHLWLAKSRVDWDGQAQARHVFGKHEWLAKSRINWNEQTRTWHICGSEKTHDLGVNVTGLAGMLDGYSGAEVTRVCETAGGLALDEAEENKGDDDPENHEVKIRMDHLTNATTIVNKGITPTVIKSYVEWANKLLDN